MCRTRFPYSGAHETSNNASSPEYRGLDRRERGFATAKQRPQGAATSSYTFV